MAERNKAHPDGREVITGTDESRPSVYVIRINEELLIARDTVRLNHSSGKNSSASRF
ncbi:MAG TPA: hypothetical protein VK892_01840 [Pyrinomonadaceae bacterium]|nr:hypothetical protein [Pyrinomonadaceae bacterium]